MSLENEILTLQKIPFFETLSPAKLKLIAFASQKMAFKKGDVIYEQGDKGENAYIILEGDADVFVTNGIQKKHVTTMYKNQILGEISVISDAPRVATVIAHTDMKVLEISRDFFEQMMRDFPEISFNVAKELAHRLEVTMAQYRQAVFKSDK